MSEPRTLDQRKADALRRFAEDVDCFFATTNSDRRPNVVPLSVLWRRGAFLLCTRRSTQTVRNIAARPAARLVYGSTRDVVLVDVTTALVELRDVHPDDLDAYREHVGWNIAAESDRYVAIRCLPHTILAWQQEPEATLMRGSRWLT
jgi:hypothetical protein